MNETLILYTLLKDHSTMYGLSKTITKAFGFIINPSFGTLQPALKRLEKKNFVKSDKFYTDGGKPYYYYSITAEGKDYLKKKLLSKFSSNPIQLIPEIKLRAICSDMLENNEKSVIYKSMLESLNSLKSKAEFILKSDTYNDNYTGRIVLDSSICEYKNLIDMIKGLDKCLQ